MVEYLETDVSFFFFFEEATMVRNAGGRVFDAVRSLAVLQTIGRPGTIVVMHHTGMCFE